MFKRYALLIAALAALFMYSCKKETIIKTPPVDKPQTPASPATIASVKIEAKYNKALTEDIEATIGANDTITAVLPAADAKKKLVITYTPTTTGSIVRLNDTLQINGSTVIDYSKGVKCEVTTSSGDIKKYVLVVKVFTGLPILYLNTPSPVTSKDNYVKGNVTVDANTGLSTDKASLSTQIKGRGNSTWALFPKKPYRLKLDAKASVLGMPAAKNWVLLANYDDKTLMRNYIALKLARRLGSSYAADCKFVEVVLNGDHIGNYLLTAQVEVHENRVNIAELKPQNTSADDITGGYLLELDTRLDEKYWFKTAKNLPFTIKSPEDITPAQLNYIQTYVQNAENALFSPTFGDPNTGYAKYFDVDSFINWYFTEEVVQNQDGRDYSSMFYYKDRNGKIGMGPVWDFDLSAGNVDYSPAKNPTGIWYIRDATWMMRLAQDPGFIMKVRNRWAQIKDREVKQIFTDIDQTAAYLKLSQQKNFTRWPILNKYVWPNAVVLGSYDLEVAYMKDFITQRVNWLNNNMASF